MSQVVDIEKYEKSIKQRDDLVVEKNRILDRVKELLGDVDLVTRANSDLQCKVDLLRMSNQTVIEKLDAVLSFNSLPTHSAELLANAVALLKEANKEKE